MAKRPCGYLSPVPRYGPPNFANFGGLAPKNFWRNGTPYFLPVRKAQGSTSCVPNFSCGVDTLSEIWGTCPTTPFKKAVFCTFAKVTISSVSSALIYTRGAAIPLPQDTTAAGGQILPYRFWICRTPWELLPLQNFEFKRRGPISAPPGDCQYKDILVLVRNYCRQFTVQTMRRIRAPWLNYSLDGGDPNMACHAILALQSLLASRGRMFAVT